MFKIENPGASDTGLPGYAGITSPGNAPSAITVGASRSFGTLARTDDTVAPYRFAQEIPVRVIRH